MNHDYRGLSKIIYELLLDAMPRHDLRKKGVIK